MTDQPTLPSVDRPQVPDFFKEISASLKLIGIHNNIEFEPVVTDRKPDGDGIVQWGKYKVVSPGILVREIPPTISINLRNEEELRKIWVVLKSVESRNPYLKLKVNIEGNIQSNGDVLYDVIISECFGDDKELERKYRFDPRLEASFSDLLLRT